MSYNKLIYYINKILKIFNFFFIKYSSYIKLIESSQNSIDYKFIKHMIIENNLKIDRVSILNLFDLITFSKSKFRQDIFVLNELGFKKNGFFVEFGAADGIYLSNTYLLEKNFNWRGILAEPAKTFHKKIFANRNCTIDTRIVWIDSNSKLIFNETYVPEISKINKFSNLDNHNRISKSKYEVNTISLIDLLEEHNAPKIIDYLSIDTEGSEFDILNAFDFTKYKFRIITCEHNNNKNRSLIHSLLVKNGYKRLFVEISEYDDWYTNSSLNLYK